MRATEIPISLNQQIEELQRELHERGSRYPRLVSKGALRKSVGEYQCDRLQSTIKVLEFLQRHGEAFKRYAKLYEVDLK